MIITPVILSGGSGTRLWPLSREYYPKQLLALLGENTLLQDTADRLAGMSAVSEPVVVCNEEHRFLVAEQLRQIGNMPAAIILEPVGRNTAPALTLAALALLARDDDPVMLVMPADHVIVDGDAFKSAVERGAAMAEQGYFVTFGIVPGAPETGYGYIKQGAEISAGQTGNGSPFTVHEISAFVEKPDLETAQAYLDSGDHLWNSGMFMMKASVWMEAVKRLRPDIAKVCQTAYEQGRRDGDFFRVEQKVWEQCPSDSIDYAVMEKVGGETNTESSAPNSQSCVIPMDAGWCDIGAWSSLWEVSQRDAAGNVIEGDAYVHDTRDTLVIAQHRFVATVGVEGLIVVETPDAVLVCQKDRAQDVKYIVNQLKNDGRSEHQIHRRVYRPWGSYEGVDAGSRFQVKRLTVKPGAILSLQMHHHRAEHWIVVSGTAKVTRGEEVFTLTENQSTYIPIGMKHRLENPGTISLEIIEVQSGSYLGEDDIVRFEDKYDRETTNE